MLEYNDEVYLYDDLKHNGRAQKVFTPIEGVCLNTTMFFYGMDYK
jgi:hypothetical protein